MKFTCFCLDLNNAVTKVIKAIAAKSISPALDGIKITAINNSLILKATNTKMTIENKISATIKEEGEFLIPAKYFSEYIKKFNDGEVTIELVDKNTIFLKHLDSSIKLKCLEISEFPQIKKVSDDRYFDITAKDLKDCIESTIFSVCADDSRPILKGCLFDIKNGFLNVVALDGYRLALYKCPIEKATDNIKIIVPAKSLSEISKLVNDEESIIKISVSDKSIMVDFGDTLLITSLIEGEFINYSQIIPDKFETEITIDRRLFDEGLDKASILTRIDKNNLVSFDISEKNLKISSVSEIGNYDENIFIGSVGKDINIGFNAKYFIDCLRQINDEFIKISFTSKSSPCILTPCEGDKYLYMILPVRVA